MTIYEFMQEFDKTDQPAVYSFLELYKFHNMSREEWIQQLKGSFLEVSFKYGFETKGKHFIEHFLDMESDD